MSKQLPECQIFSAGLGSGFALLGGPEDPREEEGMVPSWGRALWGVPGQEVTHQTSPPRRELRGQLHRTASHRLENQLQSLQTPWIHTGFGRRGLRHSPLDRKGFCWRSRAGGSSLPTCKALGSQREMSRVPRDLHSPPRHTSCSLQ